MSDRIQGPGEHPGPTAPNALSDLLTQAIRKFLIDSLDVPEHNADDVLATVDLDATAKSATSWSDLAAAIVLSIGIGAPDPDDTVDLPKR